MGQVKIARIRELNDAFRKYPWSDQPALGRTVVTAGINAYGREFVLKVLDAVAAFDNFTGDNDPHGEHDFGNLEVDGEKIYFKIDYFDADGVYGSEDPSDPKQTTRVLTVMLAEEY
jgi:Protein of unknown function (DUF3768)